MLIGTATRCGPRLVATAGRQAGPHAISAASVLAAIGAGCDAVDGALDAMSGLTSQPNLGSIAAALAECAALDPAERRAQRRRKFLEIGRSQAHWLTPHHFLGPAMHPDR